jgi:endoribonuclease Dicer
MQGMVGYVQSRGRARRKTSTFVVMIQQNSASQLDNYRSLSENEPNIRKLYQSGTPLYSRPVGGETMDDEADSGDYVYPTDLAKRERFVFPSTNAILTFNKAIGHHGHLC